MSALVITYHAVEEGPAPLCVAPELFSEHLDVLTAAGVDVLTVAELAGALARGRVPERAVALTFDDGLAGVVHDALPRMRRHGMRGTVYCVAGHLGASSDWPTQPEGAPRRPLASAAQIASLAAEGWEVGAHGTTHAPLSAIAPGDVAGEVVACRAALEAATGTTVTTYAYPYGALPTTDAAAAVAATYRAACTTRPGLVGRGADPYALPRVDAHYLRSPALLERAVTGRAGPYLALRRAGARARRLIVRDYEMAA